MRQLAVFFALLLTLATTVSAESFTPLTLPTQLNLVGTINSSLKIRMSLMRKGRDLTGSYFYENRKKNITLRGVVTDAGYLELDEYGAKDSITGHLIGVYTRDQELLGFWSKDDASTSPKLPLWLVVEGKGSPSPSHKFEVVNAPVRRDRGMAQLLVVDGIVLGFSYENVGGNAHTCTMIVDRSEQTLVWKDDVQGTSIFFTKEYFNQTQQTAKVVIQKYEAGYNITFDGFLSYFCGARAILPAKLTIRKGAKGWMGQ
ncbi:MAG: hypothetical protein U0Y68_04925 [Blastocatellia bacterium]